MYSLEDATIINMKTNRFHKSQNVKAHPPSFHKYYDCRQS